jgi:hypothetical protein
LAWRRRHGTRCQGSSTRRRGRSRRRRRRCPPRQSTSPDHRPGGRSQSRSQLPPHECKRTRPATRHRRRRRTRSPSTRASHSAAAPRPGLPSGRRRRRRPCRHRRHPTGPGCCRPARPSTCHAYPRRRGSGTCGTRRRRHRCRRPHRPIARPSGRHPHRRTCCCNRNSHLRPTGGTGACVRRREWRNPGTRRWATRGTPPQPAPPPSKPRVMASL